MILKFRDKKDLAVALNLKKKIKLLNNTGVANSNQTPTPVKIKGYEK